MAIIKLWYIKQRYNSQLGTNYYKMGQMSKTAAKQWEGSKYGSSKMLPYQTEAEYLAAVKELEAT